MSEPRFKEGDKVRVKGEKAAAWIVVGPFWNTTYGGLHYNECTYVCRRPDGTIQLIRESMLDPVGQWVPCPGKHRQAGEPYTLWPSLERWEE